MYNFCLLNNHFFTMVLNDRIINIKLFDISLSSDIKINILNIFIKISLIFILNFYKSIVKLSL